MNQFMKKWKFYRILSASKLINNFVNISFDFGNLIKFNMKMETILKIVRTNKREQSSAFLPMKKTSSFEIGIL